MAEKKTTAKPKKKKAPLSSVQKDALRDVEDRKMGSVSQALKDGKIDHGDSAIPGKGVLDPTEFDKFHVETKVQNMTETQRISKIIREHLDKFYSKGGKYQWTVGFFQPTDPNSEGANGWQALTPAMVGEAWSEELQRTVGLTVFNGALCWNGMGTFERHIICVKTKQLEQRQIVAREEAVDQQLIQPKDVGAKETGSLDIKETKKKLPLHARPDTGDGLADDMEGEAIEQVAQ